MDTVQPVKIPLKSLCQLDGAVGENDLLQRPPQDDFKRSTHIGSTQHNAQEQRRSTDVAHNHMH